MPTSRKTRVLILLGGRSAEHEISIISGGFIARSLDRERFEPILVGIDKAGRWWLQDHETISASNDPREVRVVDTGVAANIRPSPQPGTVGIGQLDLDDGRCLSFDVVFPVLHGPFGEDGCTQGLLELAGVAYVGSGVASSALCMDKIFQKQICQQLELPILPYEVLTRQDLQIGDWRPRVVALGLPLFVKPANMGSSLGIRRVADLAELDAAVDHAFEFDAKVVVEKGLVLPREIECAVLGNHDPVSSVAGELNIEHADGFYSFDAKYIDNGARVSIPAELPLATREQLRSVACRAFVALDCRGLARVDFLLDAEGTVFLNELNTMPGFTPISMYPQLWQASGMGATELVSKLIDLALDEHNSRHR